MTPAQIYRFHRRGGDSRLLALQRTVQWLRNQRLYSQ